MGRPRQEPRAQTSVAANRSSLHSAFLCVSLRTFKTRLRRVDKSRKTNVRVRFGATERVPITEAKIPKLTETGRSILDEKHR